MKALFLMGLPNNKMVTVVGYNGDGEMLYSRKGNAPFHKYWKGLVETLFIVWHAEPERRYNRPDVIVNSMNDPDTSGESLRVAEKMVALLQQQWPGLSVFNHPTHVLRTSRDAMYELCRNMPGLHVPKVVRIVPDSVADVLAQAEAAGISFPFIIRPCGTHQAENLALVRDASEIKKLEAFAYNGGPFYVTEFAEYRDADGLYRKARLVMIGDEILPRHYMTGDTWLVHDMHKTFMASRPETIAAEAHFIENWQNMIAPQALESLRKIYAQTGLDYLGFDFSIRENGELLIFEINPAQNVFIDLDEKTFPYMPTARAKLIAALNKAIAGKVGDIVVGESLARSHL